MVSKFSVFLILFIEKILAVSVFFFSCFNRLVSLGSIMMCEVELKLHQNSVVVNCSESQSLVLNIEGLDFGSWLVHGICMECTERSICCLINGSLIIKETIQ
jgi:hypothetical protein